MFDPAIKMLCNMPTLQDELVRMEDISFFLIEKKCWLFPFCVKKKMLTLQDELVRMEDICNNIS